MANDIGLHQLIGALSGVHVSSIVVHSEAIMKRTTPSDQREFLA